MDSNSLTDKRKNVDVSVIILNYNQTELTSKCIDSIYTHTSGISFELVVVDNASTQGSPDSLKQEFPDIILIKSGENLGFSKGNNLGIENAKGKYILLLNSDTELQNNAIGISYNKIESAKNVGVIGGQLISPNGSIQHNCGRFPSVRLELVELFRFHKLMGSLRREKTMLGYYFDHEKEIKTDWLWGTFFMIRKEIIDSFDNGKFADEFFMYYEDVLWCYQVNKLGYSCLFYPEAKVMHHSMSGADDEKKAENMQMIARNEAIFIRKYYNWFHGRTLLFVKSLNEMLSGNKKRRTLPRVKSSAL
ncbi:MAG: glycosyltransferase family 2 protein [Bacteroidetes bacterium]|nr:glycosyltransferase family 2 protein [Bacteroidota bacterium]